MIDSSQVHMYIDFGLAKRECDLERSRYERDCGRERLCARSAAGNAAVDVATGRIDPRSFNRETVLRMDRSRIRERSTARSLARCALSRVYVRLKIWDTTARYGSRRLIKHAASRHHELDATTHACVHASIINELVINPKLAR